MPNATKMKYEKAIILNDLHFPWACEPAITLALQVAKVLQPDRVIINGDLVDMWEISSFVKNPQWRDKAQLANEIIQGRAFLTKLRAMFPKAEIRYVLGNHEYRWMKFLATHAAELAKLRGLTLEEQLDCDKLDIKVVNSGNRESSWLWGKLLVGHFDQVNKHSAYTAKNLIESKGISLIQAHTHRGGSFYKRTHDRDIVGHENFCLCDRNPTYVDRPNWTLGFGIVYKDLASDFFYYEAHPITEIEKGSKMTYRTFFNGEIFQV